MIQLGQVEPGSSIELYRTYRPEPGRGRPKPRPKMTGSTLKARLTSAHVRWHGTYPDPHDPELVWHARYEAERKTSHYAECVLEITRPARCIQGVQLQVQEHGVSPGGTRYTTVCTPWGEMVQLDSTMRIWVR